MAKKKKPDISDLLNLLVDQAHEILTWKIIAAKRNPRSDKIPEGLPSDYYDYKHKELDEIVDMVKPLISSVQATKQVQAGSIKDVTDGLKRGRISIKEAVDLIKILKDIDEVNLMNSM